MDSRELRERSQCLASAVTTAVLSDGSKELRQRFGDLSGSLYRRQVPCRREIHPARIGDSSGQ
jgi:hypothetical protein